MASAAPPPPPPRAFVLDLEDVLLPWNTVGHWQWAWKPQGPMLPERHARSVLRREMRAWDRRRWRALVGAEPPVDLARRRQHLFEVLTGLAGHKLPDAEANAVVDRFDRPAGEIETYDDALPAIARLAADRVPVGVVTELPRPAAQRALARGALGALPILAAGDDPPEARPPARSGFRAAVRSLGVPAARTIFIGDLFWSDVRAAARAGLTAVLLDRYDRFGGVEARRIAGLAELAGLVPGPVADEGDAPAPEAGPPAGDDDG